MEKHCVLEKTAIGVGNVASKISFISKRDVFKKHHCICDTRSPWFVYDEWGALNICHSIQTFQRSRCIAWKPMNDTYIRIRSCVCPIKQKIATYIGIGWLFRCCDELLRCEATFQNQKFRLIEMKRYLSYKNTHLCMDHHLHDFSIQDFERFLKEKIFELQKVPLHSK